MAAPDARQGPLVMRLLAVDPITAGGLGFAAAQLAAELCAPADDDPPGGRTSREIGHER